MESSLTVIIPCYNKDKYLNNCICSILEQTRLPDEILIIDDSSTDRSREIIKEISQKSKIVRGIFQESNVGVSATRNKGILEARSKYITMIDADDIMWSKEKLEKEMAMLEEKEDEDMLVFSLTFTMDENENPLNQQQMKNTKIAVGKNLKPKFLAGSYTNQYIPRDYCIRRDILIDVGMFDESLSYFEDFDLLLRLSDRCEFVCTYKPGTGYRQVMGGLSDQSISRYRAAMKSFTKKYWDTLSISEKVLYFKEKYSGYARRAYAKVLK